MSKGAWKSKSKINLAEQYVTGNIYQDNEHDLVVAAIRLALKDYQSAYKSKNYTKQEALEVWFYSPIFDAWTDGAIDPDYLLKEVRRQVDAGKYNMYHQARMPKEGVLTNDN